MLETVILGAVLFGMYLLNGSAVIPLMTGAAVAAVFAAAALVYAFKRNSARAKDLGLKAVLLAAVAGLIFGVNALNNGMAARGAARIGAACEAYKTKTGSYPEKLSQLAPEYLKAVPAAKATVMWRYYRLKGGRVLYALDPWLMMAGYYDLGSKKPGFTRIDEMMAEK
ncbi:MAG: hypothetical protein AB7V08_09275 [Elusimicrobiales bacterium]